MLVFLNMFIYYPKGNEILQCIIFYVYLYPTLLALPIFYTMQNLTQNQFGVFSDGTKLDVAT